MLLLFVLFSLSAHINNAMVGKVTMVKKVTPQHINKPTLPISDRIEFTDSQLKHITEVLRSSHDRWAFRTQIDTKAKKMYWISAKTSQARVEEALLRTNEQLHEIYEKKICKEYLKIITRLNFFAHFNDSDISESNYYAAINNNCFNQLISEINSHDS